MRMFCNNKGNKRQNTILIYNEGMPGSETQQGQKIYSYLEMGMKQYLPSGSPHHGSLVNESD